MARNKWGALGPFIGKLGGSVGYLRRGTPVVRALPHPSQKPRTEGQKASSQAFSLVMKFVSPINSFIAFGYHPSTIGKGAIPQNAFTQYLRQHCISGEYPDQYIDCSKVKVSLGDIKAPVDGAVSRESNLLHFSWAVDPSWSTSLNGDQVMLLAYHPRSKRADYAVGLALKNQGEATLEMRLGSNLKPDGVSVDVVETYLAFISNDRQRVSDSVYTGQIVL
jgi:hypothetical protein